MRAIMNISLPMQMASYIDNEVRALSFASRSEFIRNLVREWQNKQVVKEILNSKKATDSGEYEVLHSLADLD